ncbi:MAG: hypothetical protein KBD83_04415 [Gammaproteobacteria bacterium]|nr:hypothetical protein [Gammaproteobacteria bacterium]
MFRHLENDYLHMSNRGKVPLEASELGQLLKKNPKLLNSEFEAEDVPYSVISMLLHAGHLVVADFILKKNGQIAPKADPSYCGQVNGGIPALLCSAGVNFYLALVTLQFYFQQNRLPELLAIDAIGKPFIKKTHYDCLYYEDDKQIKHAVMIEANESEQQSDIDAYQETTAKLFMRIAYEAYKAERILLTTTAFPDEKEQAHRVLGHAFLRIAFMEDYSYHAFNYCLDQALTNYRQASLEDQGLYIETLETYIAHREQIFELQREKRKLQLQVGPVDDRSYRTRTPEEWRESYDSAYRRDYAFEGESVSRHSIHITEGMRSITIDTLIGGELCSRTEEEVLPLSSSQLRFRSTSGPSAITGNPMTFTYWGSDVMPQKSSQDKKHMQI